MQEAAPAEDKVAPPEDDDEEPPEPEPEYALWGTSLAHLSDEEDDAYEDPRGVDELQTPTFSIPAETWTTSETWAQTPALSEEPSEEASDFGDFQVASAEGEWVTFADDPASRHAALDDESVALIKATMGALHIAPPPWVRKMQHVQRIQQQLGSSAAASTGDGDAEVGALDSQWAAHVQQRTGPGGVFLSDAAVAQASPMLAMPAAAGLSGVSAPKRVTAKQLAAERRALRAAKAKAEAAAR